MPSSAAGAVCSSDWRLALSYLAHCPQHGRAAAEALLEALPVSCVMRFVVHCWPLRNKQHELMSMVAL